MRGASLEHRHSSQPVYDDVTEYRHAGIMYGIALSHALSSPPVAVYTQVN